MLSLTEPSKDIIFPSANWWMSIKNAVVHSHDGKLLGHKKEGDVTLATAQMDLEGIMLSEVSQSEKDKYRTISLICGIYLTK